jgi:two-component system OmpR family response regulator
MIQGQVVLVVDDDPVARTIATHVAQSLGCVALEARSAKEATRIAKDKRPDLVILDGLLPDSDGVRWLREQRAEGNTVAVLFSSAFWKDVGSHRTLTEELNVAAVVPKPLRADVLARTIRQALDRKSPAARPAP